MTDKELLELAAKAAGYIVKDAGWTDEFLCRMVDVYSDEGEQCHQRWNPLTDDGDALRLAVKLKMRIYIYEDTSVAATDVYSAHQLQGNDPYAATRRAIVRAAAQIGKAST